MPLIGHCRKRSLIFLFSEAGVFLLPAIVYRSAYGDTPTDRFRIGYGRLNVEEGLEAVQSYPARRAA